MTEHLIQISSKQGIMVQMYIFGFSKAVDFHLILAVKQMQTLIEKLIRLKRQTLYEEGSGPRVLLKSGPGTRGRSACGPTHVTRLEFPRETGLILRCREGREPLADRWARVTSSGQWAVRGSELLLLG